MLDQKWKVCGVGVTVLLLHGRKSHHLSKTVDNCLLRDMCDVIFYFYNFKDFQWFSFEEICFFLNYNYMEVWIKDVWKNSKCDSDNKRHLKKKRTSHTWSMNSHKVGLKTRIYYVIYWLFLEICVDVQMKWQ